MVEATPVQSARSDTVVDFAASPPDVAGIVRIIAEQGFVILRNAFARDDMDDMLRQREWWFKAPAAGGVPGYCKYDYEKKVVQTSQLGQAALRILLDERLLDIIEAFVGHEVILAESFTKLDRGVDYVYFPPHTDYAPDYRPSSHYEKIRVTAEDMKTPLGLSYVLYHHDTTSGAFCYSAGSHRMFAHRGGEIGDYPPEEQEEILRTWTRLDGKAGDLVLFDPRGFHGQDQPTTTDRIATITRYWRSDVFGFHQVRPVPVYTMDMAGLAPRQLRTLGVGALSLTPLEFDHHAGFKKRRAYKLAVKLIEHGYDLDYLKKQMQPLRSAVKRLLRVAPGNKP